MLQRLETILVNNVLPKAAATTLSKYLTWSQAFVMISSSKKLMTQFWDCEFDDALRSMSFVTNLIKQHIRIDVVAGKIKMSVEDCEPFSSDDISPDSAGFYFGVPSAYTPLPSFLDNYPQFADAELILPPPAPVDAFILCDWNVDPRVIRKLPEPYVLPGTQVIKKFTAQLSKPHELIEGDGVVHVKQLTMDINRPQDQMRFEFSVDEDCKLDHHEWLLLCANDITALWISKVGVRVRGMSGDLVMVSSHTADQHDAICTMFGIPTVKDGTSVIVPTEKILNVDLWTSVEDPVSEEKPIPVSSVPMTSDTESRYNKIAKTDGSVPRIRLSPLRNGEISEGQWKLILAFIFFLISAWVMAVFGASNY